MAAVPSIGRADRAAPEADLTRALYERYAAQIFRYCLHQLGSREEAEDAVQSTFLNAFRGIKRGIVPEQESAWLFKIAQNVCLSRRRSTWRRGRIESPADFELVEEIAPAPTRLADELAGLRGVLEQIPENQRRAILLREWQGLSYREIAAELELSQTAVETLIFRARRSLARGLEEPPQQQRRLVRAADLGNILTGLKSMFLGGTAAVAKAAAVVAVVGAGTVAATEPAHRAHHARPPVPTVQARVHVQTFAPAVGVGRGAPLHTAAPPSHKAPPVVFAPATKPPVIAETTPPAPVAEPPAAVVSTPPPADVQPAVPVAAPPPHTSSPDTSGGNGAGAGHGRSEGRGHGGGRGQSSDSPPGQSGDQGQGPADQPADPAPAAIDTPPGNGNGNGHDQGGNPGHGH